jgi:hypothetical protein
MTARDKIEKLTNSWYGFALVSALWGFWESGIGVFSAVWALIGLVCSLGVTFFFGRRLLNKGGITRLFLVVVSFLGLVGWSLGTYGFARQMMSSFRFGLLFDIAFAIASVSMYFRSIRTLTDNQVKTYVG